MEDIKAPFLTAKAYDNIKWVALVLFPALAALYYTLGTAWGLPNPGGVTATLAALTLFLGQVLGFNKRRYDKEQQAWAAEAGVVGGQMVVTTDDEGVPNVSLDLDYDLEELAAANKVELRVDRRKLGA